MRIDDDLIFGRADKKLRLLPRKVCAILINPGRNGDPICTGKRHYFAEVGDARACACAMRCSTVRALVARHSGIAMTERVAPAPVRDTKDLFPVRLRCDGDGASPPHLSFPIAVGAYRNRFRRLRPPPTRMCEPQSCPIVATDLLKPKPFRHITVQAISGLNRDRPKNFLGRARGGLQRFHGLFLQCPAFQGCGHLRWLAQRADVETFLQAGFRSRFAAYARRYSYLGHGTLLNLG